MIITGYLMLYVNDNTKRVWSKKKFITNIIYKINQNYYQKNI